MPTGGAADFVFPTSVWTNLSDTAPKTYFLFEGSSEGLGQLEIVFLQQDGVTKFGEGGSVWVDLRDIKEMYLRALASPQPAYPYDSTTDQPPAPNITAQVDSTGGMFVADPNEDTTNPTYIVFVHGFNQTYPQSTNFAETMFKRLWQRGYKGRFASFRWPTFGDGTVPYGAAGTYNDSEYVAWNSGTALMNFAATLGSYQIDVVAHSMGNVVASEAIKEGMAPSHYALLHAASSASCYSNGTSAFTVTNTSYTVPDNDTDSFTQSLGYTGSLGGISGGIVNFYDQDDTTITTWWNSNNQYFKPQSLLLGLTGIYDYSPSAPSGHKLTLTTGVLIDTTRLVTSPSEAKSYVDQSLTGAVGCNTAVAGSIPAVVSENVFGDSHSYEWTDSI